MKTTRWTGVRTVDARKVRRTDGTVIAPLPMGLRVFNHSPAGFEWGYGGSGPAQLALAIVLDHLGYNSDDKTQKEKRAIAADAIAMHQSFKSAFVAGFPEEEWALDAETITAWIERWRTVHAAAPQEG